VCHAPKDSSSIGSRGSPRLYRQLHATKELENIPAIIVGADLLQDVAWKACTHHLVILSKPFSVDELLRIMIRVELSASK
jgi:hypothetical protein